MKLFVKLVLNIKIRYIGKRIILFVSATILSDNFFLLTDDYRRLIMQADSHMNNTQTVKSLQNGEPYAVTYDFNRNQLFWSDSNNGVITTSSLNGSFSQVVKIKNGKRFPLII